MKKIAIIGGGGTGCCTAAVSKLRGFDVILYERRDCWADNIEGIIEKGGVELTGCDYTGFAEFPITDNLEEAVNFADIVLVISVSWRHQELAEALAPLLKPNHVVVFSAGNFASIQLKNILGLDSPVLVGDMGGSIFSARMIDKGVGLIANPHGYVTKNLAAFPAKHTGKVIAAINPFFPCTSMKNVFETALNSPNVTIHLACSLLCCSQIDKKQDFALYAEGLTKSQYTVCKAVDDEKIAVLEKFGYEAKRVADEVLILMDYENHRELDLFRSLKGPSSMMHRYIREDATCGESMLICLAEMVGVDVPLLKALVKIASVINGEDYIDLGFTLKSLSIESNSPEELNKYLYDGSK